MHEHEICVCVLNRKRERDETGAHTHCDQTTVTAKTKLKSLNVVFFRVPALLEVEHKNFCFSSWETHVYVAHRVHKSNRRLVSFIVCVRCVCVRVPRAFDAQWIAVWMCEYACAQNIKCVMSSALRSLSPSPWFDVCDIRIYIVSFFVYAIWL